MSTTMAINAYGKDCFTLILLVACLDSWFSLFLPILSLLSKSPPEFIVRHLISYDGKYEKE
jgi:hypothetical protein